MKNIKLIHWSNLIKGDDDYGGDDDDDDDDDDNDDDDDCFCGMIDRRKAFKLISSRDHWQRSSPSRISIGLC